jgi:cytochrome P450
VPTGVTHATAADTTLRGYRIPKGTWVFPMLVAVAEDENLWPEPEHFKPKRFLDASGNFVKNEALVPFSMGKFRED